MSEINFEALGRCEHLKGRITEVSSLRISAFRKLKYGFSDSESTVIDRVHHADIDKLRDAIDELERADVELMALVEEYNKYAPEAGKRVINIVKR
ncbi:hypothetical protein ACS90Y_001634 [Yersinia enterocolitica]|uniref:hypothetical protein n=1 Tax=Yersinia enterocolitica TaxID=630 RepID=UPI0038BC42BA|nr:hypothetical protein [Yersinia enterocolitica]